MIQFCESASKSLQLALLIGCTMHNRAKCHRNGVKMATSFPKNKNHKTNLNV